MNKHQVGIKRFDTSLPLPEYKTSGAAAVDLYARLETTLPPHSVSYIPLNVALELPTGSWALLAARSSLHKKGLLLVNGIGIGDEDFCGDQDEYQAPLYNFSDEAVVVKRGERIVQLLIMSLQKIVFVEKKKFDAIARGGFGSTGQQA